MSEENAGLARSFTEFASDFNKFFELVKILNSYKEKFQRYVNDQRHIQEHQSLDDLIAQVFRQWAMLTETVTSVRRVIDIIETPTCIDDLEEYPTGEPQSTSEGPTQVEVIPKIEEDREAENVNNEDQLETGEQEVDTCKVPEAAAEVVVELVEQPEEPTSEPIIKVNAEVVNPQSVDESGAVVLEPIVEVASEEVGELNSESVSEPVENVTANSDQVVAAPVETADAEPVEKVVSDSLQPVSVQTNERDTNKETEKGDATTAVEQPSSNVVNGEENATESRDIEEKPRIRLVPLQNLLSQPEKSEQLLHVTISDSDDDDVSVVVPPPTRITRATGTRQQPQQIFELSDSDDEPVQSEGSKLKELLLDLPKDQNQNGLSRRVNNSTDKHIRIKYTPIRKPTELASQRQKRNRIISSDEEETVKPLDRDSKLIKLEDKSKEDSSNGANENNIVISEARTCSPFQKETVRTETRTSNDFKKGCVVRIKREPVFTAHHTKSDVSKAKSNGHTRNCLTSVSNKSANRKVMASDSESDVEVLPENSGSDDTSSSDSEVVAPRKKRIFEEKTKTSSTSSESESNNTSTAGTTASVRKKRKIVRKSSSSSDNDGSDGSDLENGDKNKKRKKIRKLINEKNLDDDTKRATREEEERKRRIEERQKMYNQIYVKNENVEIEELILDFDAETKKPLLKVDNGLLKRLKPHQVNGVKFIWDSCFETVKDCREKPGSGCILAHCMGLGKTMQIVTLTHTLLTNSDVTHFERVLIISPLSTLNNWAREYYHWISFAKNKNIEVYDMSKYKDKNMRAVKLEEWFTDGGVCIIGYDMYRILSNEKTKGLRKKQKEMLQRSLVDPGPDVVICDEGHLLKNEKTSLSKAVTKMRTKRRIVLTGTPLQNNLKEYYCMIQFIKPNLLGTYKEYLNRFVNPITNGQYTDSTERDIRLMKHRSHILHKMLEACLQRRDYSVLAPYLPPKYEYVIFVTLSDVQKQLYDHYMNTQRDLVGDANGKGAKLFQDFQDLRRIWTHPMNLRVNSDTVIRKKLARYDSEESMKDFIDDHSEESTTSESDSSSSDEAEPSKAKTVRTRNTRMNKDLSEDDSDSIEVQAKDDPSEWWTRFVDEAELNNIHHSPKLVVLMTLLQRCEEIGDKVLVFSQSLQSLDVIEHFLSLIDRKTRGEEIEGDVGNFKGRWRPGVNYFRLDGSRTVENRESMCKSFNDRSNLSARLFLISTRAGGLGINLVAANRVVIFDVSWNPSHDTQSIFRVYRFGQTKPCYIYRLIALGTMEQKVYERQVAKQATAKRVIDEQQISRHYNQNDLQELYTYELEPSTPREIPILPKDRLFAELLSNHEKLLFKYHEHDSLLENEDSENLSEEERKAAWDEYEAEKTRPPQPAMQYMAYDRSAYMANYGNPSGSVTSNKIFGFRSDILLRLLNMKGCQDHPELTGSQVIQLVPEYLQRLYFEMNNGDPTLYKELLELHKSLETPGGMYTNPLLFANQTPPNPVVPVLGGHVRPYGQVHPGTSNFNSNEVYEVD